MRRETAPYAPHDQREEEKKQTMTTKSVLQHRWIESMSNEWNNKNLDRNILWINNSEMRKKPSASYSPSQMNEVVCPVVAPAQHHFGSHKNFIHHKIAVQEHEKGR